MGCAPLGIAQQHRADRRGSGRHSGDDRARAPRAGRSTGRSVASRSARLGRGGGSAAAGHSLANALRHAGCEWPSAGRHDHERRPGVGATDVALDPMPSDRPARISPQEQRRKHGALTHSLSFQGSVRRPLRPVWAEAARMCHFSPLLDKPAFSARSSSVIGSDRTQPTALVSVAERGIATVGAHRSQGRSAQCAPGRILSNPREKATRAQGGPHGG